MTYKELEQWKKEGWTEAYRTACAGLLADGDFCYFCGQYVKPEIAAKNEFSAVEDAGSEVIFLICCPACMDRVPDTAWIDENTAWTNEV